jgi:hypothetical protein
MKFKQVLLNLILQSIQGVYKGSIKIAAEMTFENQTPSLRVDIENTKLDVQKKDNMRIVKLAKMTDFRAILKSKVDINVKIAKILTNAINWKFEFSGNRGTKLSFTLPLQGEVSPRRIDNIHLLN